MQSRSSGCRCILFIQKNVLVSQNVILEWREAGGNKMDLESKEKDGQKSDKKIRVKEINREIRWHEAWVGG